MRNMNHVFSSLCLLLVLLVRPVICISQTIPNGGFERGAKDQPDVWFSTYTDWLRPTVESVIFHWDKEIRHSGERSVSIRVYKTFRGPEVHYNWTAPIEGWQAGSTYEVTAWVRTQNLKRRAFLVIQVIRGGELIDLIDRAKPGVKGTQDWTQIKTRFKVPRGTAVLQLRIGATADGSNKDWKVWFDDIEITKVEKPEKKQAN